MKTLKIFLSVAIFCFLAVGNVHAQSISTKNIDWPINFTDTESPELGTLTGTGIFHMIVHIDKSGNLVWLKANMHVTELISSETGEVFSSNSVEKYVASTIEPGWFAGWVKAVWRGNKGTRVVCYEAFEVNFDTGEWISIEHNHKQW